MHTGAKRIYIAFILLMAATGVSDCLRGVLAPVFMEHFALDAVRFGWIVTASYIGNLVFLLLGGRLLDRLPKKQGMLLFCGLWMAALASFVAFDSFPALLVGMAVALGSSTILSTTINVVTPYLFAASPAMMVNLLFFVQGTGTSGSQMLVGVFADSYEHWRWINIALLAAGAVAVFVLAGTHFPTPKLHQKERGARVWNNPAFLPLAGLFGLYFIAEHGLMNWLVTYAAEGLGLAAASGSTALALFYGTITVGRLLFSPLLDRFGIGRMLQVFAACAAAVFCAGAALGAPGLWVVAVSGMAFSILYPTLVMTITRLWPVGNVSSACGTIISIASLADISFNFLFGHLAEGLGYRASFTLMPGAMVLFAVGLWLFCRRFKAQLAARQEAA